MLAVSTSPIIARFLDNVPAITISFWRMAIGAIIMWIISFLKKQTPLQNANRKRTLIAGIFLGIHFALFFGAIKLTTIANATFYFSEKNHKGNLGILKFNFEKIMKILGFDNKFSPKTLIFGAKNIEILKEVCRFWCLK